MAPRINSTKTRNWSARDLDYGRERISRGVHIEAPGCIVNIYTGLHDGAHDVTAIEIICDQYPGDTWTIPIPAPIDADLFGRKALHVRVVKQGDPPKGGDGLIEQSRAEWRAIFPNGCPDPADAEGDGLIDANAPRLDDPIFEESQQGAIMLPAPVASVREVLGRDLSYPDDLAYVVRIGPYPSQTATVIWGDQGGWFMPDPVGDDASST